MSFPKLPQGAVYLVIDNAKRRNALSLAVLRSLRDQLHTHNTGPDGQLRILPRFQPSLLDDLEVAQSSQTHELSWLVNSEQWQRTRKDLPRVLVLRTEGPVFCSGHDLAELRRLPYQEVKETFALCAEVMSLIRRSPVPVVAPIQGLATAAGAQLAFTADLPVATSKTKFQLPGTSIGLPCTSPSTAVSRRLGSALTYRMLAMAEPVEAHQLPQGAIDIVEKEADFEQHISYIVKKLSSSAAQPQAFGKWAYWTQIGLSGSSLGSDGYEEAVSWAGRVMALHARTADAKEGIDAFFSKRTPEWVT